MDMPGVGEWPHLLLSGLAAIAVYVAKRAVSDVDKRQNQAEREIKGIKDDQTEHWQRHDAEHTRIHESHEDTHTELRDDISRNESDIARLLERTKNL
jgi:septal ring factor EnvC (AmiA/AmiB activator)